MHYTPDFNRISPLIPPSLDYSDSSTQISSIHSISPLPRPPRCLTPYPTQSLFHNSHPSTPSPLSAPRPSSPHPAVLRNTPNTKQHLVTDPAFLIPPTLRMSTLPTSPTDEEQPSPLIPASPPFLLPRTATPLSSRVNSPQIARRRRASVNDSEISSKKGNRPSPIFIPRISHPSKKGLSTPVTIHRSAPVGRILSNTSRQATPSIRIGGVDTPHPRFAISNGVPMSTEFSPRYSRAVQLEAASVPSPRTPSTGSSGGATARPLHRSRPATAFRMARDDAPPLETLQLEDTMLDDITYSEATSDIPHLHNEPSPGWGSFRTADYQHAG